MNLKLFTQFDFNKGVTRYTIANHDQKAKVLILNPAQLLNGPI